MIRQDNSVGLGTAPGFRHPRGNGDDPCARIRRSHTRNGLHLETYTTTCAPLGALDVPSIVLISRLFLSVTVVYQKRLKKERRARKRLQERLELEMKRNTQLEDALKATGASSEQIRAITGTYAPYFPWTRALGAKS